MKPFQLDFFSIQKDTEKQEKIKKRIHFFQQLLTESGHNWDLVAVNKMYDSVVIYDSENTYSKLQTASERNGKITCDYSATGRDGFGTNLLILDERFLGYESYTLEKGRELIGCGVSTLNDYLKEGWKIHARSGVMLNISQ